MTDYFTSYEYYYLVLLKNTETYIESAYKYIFKHFNSVGVNQLYN